MRAGALFDRIRSSTIAAVTLASALAHIGSAQQAQTQDTRVEEAQKSRMQPSQISGLRKSSRFSRLTALAPSFG
jgi:hypothetical protein